MWLRFQYLFCIEDTDSVKKSGNMARSVSRKLQERKMRNQEVGLKLSEWNIIACGFLEVSINAGKLKKEMFDHART